MTAVTCAGYPNFYNRRYRETLTSISASKALKLKEILSVWGFGSAITGLFRVLQIDLIVQSGRLLERLPCEGARIGSSASFKITVASVGGA